MKLILGKKRERQQHFGIAGEWTRDAVIDREIAGIKNLAVQVVHRRGRQVRIPYKPRGENVGFHWWGDVYEDGRCLWSGRVTKSAGVRGILKAADLIK